jgi:hypothetical protein
MPTAANEVVGFLKILGQQPGAFDVAVSRVDTGALDCTSSSACVVHIHTHRSQEKDNMRMNITLSMHTGIPETLNTPKALSHSHFSSKPLSSS